MFSPSFKAEELMMLKISSSFFIAISMILIPELIFSSLHLWVTNISMKIGSSALMFLSQNKSATKPLCLCSEMQSE